MGEHEAERPLAQLARALGVRAPPGRAGLLAGWACAAARPKPDAQASIVVHCNSLRRCGGHASPVMEAGLADMVCSAARSSPDGRAGVRGPNGAATGDARRGSGLGPLLGLRARLRGEAHQGRLVQGAVRLDDQGPGARAIAEGEPQPSRVLADPALDDAEDDPPLHLHPQPVGREAELLREVGRVDRDLLVADVDDRLRSIPRRARTGRPCAPHRLAAFRTSHPTNRPAIPPWPPPIWVRDGAMYRSTPGWRQTGVPAKVSRSHDYLR